MMGNSEFGTEQKSEKGTQNSDLEQYDRPLSSPQGSTITPQDHRSKTPLPTLHFSNSNFIIRSNMV
uniref:Uncharacterized protein n=1 Tax=Setaria italica TaxID=4555 RepID=K3ZYU6_SETIT